MLATNMRALFEEAFYPDPNWNTIVRHGQAHVFRQTPPLALTPQTPHIPESWLQDETQGFTFT